ncbi:MAG: RNA 2',3'-cyclic phosphodiesterase [Alphaproteobacteria bacterium]|nr:RNA 2',3'-cyclic phosphodiesterase [Alphaproteobacteria bacterium]MBL6939731.1 RNA 2',3'-cyclic phosphodiesterase [Alphaproteobacteria bacterium]MBL7096947.1 RNA 2',3'-cyclic phosphodiesterase [Alphaproteobacteria bacterium]
MQRLFVALSIPDTVARAMALIQNGVPGARWQTREQLHLTLRFIGEVDGRDAAMIDDALAGIEATRFVLEPHGVGQFGNKNPHALWAGVRPNEALLHLQRKVETAMQRAGREPDRSKYVPHITLARLTRPNVGRVMDYLADHALFTPPPFAVDGFILYSSALTSDGSIYRAERGYPLR